MLGKYLKLLSALIFSVGLMGGLNVVSAQEAVKVTAVGEKKYQEYSSYIEASALEDAKRQAVKKLPPLFQNLKNVCLKI